MVPARHRSRMTSLHCLVRDSRATRLALRWSASDPPGVAFPQVLPRRGELPVEVTTSERYASGGAPPELAARNLIEAFYTTVDRLGDEMAIKDEAREKELSWNELRDTVHRIAGGLSELGLEKGDTIALMLNNRWEFIPCDLAAVSLGGVPYSIYQTYVPEQIQYLLTDAKSSIAIIEKAFLDNFNEARRGLPDLEHLIVVDGEGGDHTLDEVMAMAPDFDPAESVQALGPDDLLTLIYTSGTTGPPKGVQLTHRNLLFAVATADEIIDFPQGGRVISWLPAAHVAERNAHYYLPVTKGLSVTVCADPRKIAEFLPRVRPSWFFAVPRIFEKLKSGLEAMMAGLPDEQREPAQKGLEAALAKVRAEQAGEEVPAEIAEAAAQADEQMFSQLRKQLRLDEDGEVLVKADCVMPGYRNLAEKNTETFTEDGWLRTGDIGEFDQDGYLKIVDRKKELIINAAGKNMSPANIEAHLKTA